MQKMCITDKVYSLFRSLDAFVLSDTSQFLYELKAHLKKSSLYTKQLQFKFLGVQTHIGFKTPNTLQ